MHKKIFIFLVIFTTIFSIGGAGYCVYRKYTTHVVEKVVYKTLQEKDSYVRFDMEAYDQISQNYWVSPKNYKNYNLPDLPEMFHLSLQKVTNVNQALSTSTRSGVAEMLAHAFSLATSTDAKKQIALKTVTVVLYNLIPIQRNGLLSDLQETALRQNVSNINPTTDLYGDLGLQKGASATQVALAYTQKKARLEKSSAIMTQVEIKTEIKKISYAQNVLTNPQNKDLYDQGHIEPTLARHIDGTTLYVDMRKISPSTLIEFAHSIDTASTTPKLSSMIIDVRGNVGGSLDFLQGFLGLFVGINQYAFDLFHQEDYQVQRTTQNNFPELVRYGEIAFLTDKMTQSTAELTTATFKKFHLARVVGTTSRGWGTVENTYPLMSPIDNGVKYSLLLVNSITLRDDNEPIETRGVSPDVDTQDPHWKSKLGNFFHSTSLIQAIQKEI